MRLRPRVPAGEVTRSIRVRLTLWYVAVLATVLIVFSLGVYFFLIESISADVNHMTQTYRRILTTYAAQSPMHLKQVPKLTGTVLGQISIKYQARNDANGQQVTIGPFPGSAADRDLEGALFTPKKQGCHQTKGNHLICTWLVFSKRHVVLGAVAMGASLNSVDDAQSRLRTALLLGVPLALLIALVGGWGLASRALSPVEDLRRTAQSITATDLSRRIGLRRKDELGRLADTLDDMIARLDAAFTEQRRLTGDVSHELRTPLSVIQAQTSLALRRPRTPDEYAATLRSIQEESDRMSKIVGDLLLLARAEAGQESIERDPVRLDAIAKWTVDQMAKVASENGVVVRASTEPVMIEGDADRLRQLVLNLVDNAVKYSDSGGSVEVKVAADSGMALLQVADTGVGIEASSLPHIFQRFYRDDRARSRVEGGSGLGLAIAHWVAEAHGGTIEASSRQGEGSTFTVRIPLHSIEAAEASAVSRHPLGTDPAGVPTG